MRKTLFLTIALLFLLSLLPATALTAPPVQDVACVEEVVVQADDWLSKLADKYFGDLFAFPAIVEATNAKAAEDDTFTHIANPHLIEPGWKLCIVSPEAAVALLENQAARETVYPLTLVDGLGREVTLEAEPQRIVSLIPSNTEILFALGLGDRVVGVTKYDTYPPEAAEKTVIGGITGKSISVEAVIALEPDLVLANDELQQPALDTLAENGLTVFATNSTGLADVYRAIGWIGQLADVQAEADALISQLQTDIAAISAQVQQIPVDDRPTVFYEVWPEPLYTAGPDTFIGQLITLAGGRNIFDEVGAEFPEVSPELVVARNPAVILAPESDADNLTPEALAARPGWSEIEAVQQGRVYLLDTDLISRPGPRLALALREVAAALYPDVFAD